MKRTIQKIATIGALVGALYSGVARAEENDASITAGITTTSEYVTSQGLPTDNDPSLQPWVSIDKTKGKNDYNLTLWGSHDGNNWSDRGILASVSRELYKDDKNTLTGTVGASHWETDGEDGDYRFEVSLTDLSAGLTWDRGRFSLTASAAHDFQEGDGEYYELEGAVNLATRDNWSVDAKAKAVWFDDYVFGLDEYRGENLALSGSFKAGRFWVTPGLSYFRSSSEARDGIGDSKIIPSLDISTTF